MKKKSNIEYLEGHKIGLCILAHSRVKHLRKTVNAVLKYKNFKDKIYIFVDNFSHDDLLEKKEQCKIVQSYLNKIKSNKIIIIKSKTKIGPRKNWYRAYEYMFKIFNKVIVLEDDIVIKKNFLPFMKYYLNKFEKSNEIISITGFATPVNLPNNYKYDCYLSNRSMSWSKATWKRVWKQFKKIKLQHHKITQNKKNLELLSCAGQDLVRTIKLDQFGFVNSFQVWWIWNIVRRNGLCINPVENLVNNIGFDGSGYHMNKREKFFFNKEKFKNKIRMKKIYFSEKINSSFQNNFKIKNLSFFLFRYLNNNILEKIIKIKFKILKKGF